MRTRSTCPLPLPSLPVRAGLLAASLAAALAGCIVDNRGTGTGTPDLGAAGDGPGGSPDGETRLTGKVVAPEGTIPIAGALVYLTAAPPQPIPDGVYCDKCVHIVNGTPYTRTALDGTFDFVVPRGDWYLVVQKGAFRRVRRLGVTGGVLQVPLALTTMPSITNKQIGDDVPKIAVVLGAWDPIEIVLARLGLQATITKGAFGTAQVLSKDARAFAIYGLHGLGETSPYPPATTLLTTPSEIEKYHIVFIPCSGSANTGDGGPQCSGVFNTDPRVKTTIEGFVRKGGRVFVSDWSYEYVRQIFPGFVSWRGQSQTIGSACVGGGGDQSVTGGDADLRKWLDLQGKSLSTVKDAWTYMTGVSPRQDLDSDGKPATITPKVWVEADGDPATASFHHGCGRVLFTTYHTQPTSESAAPLEPQALALLYLVLEVGVCVDDLIPG